MTMLDISTGLLKQLPEKPSMSRNGSHAELTTSVPGSYSGRGSVLDAYSNFHSADVSSAQSPQSGDYTSDDDMEDNFETRQ
jgi:hypothetical protein